MTVTVKRSQPIPDIDTVTIVLDYEEARVFKLLAGHRSRIIALLDERISNGEVPAMTTAKANSALKLMWDALHEANINWSAR